MIDPNRTRQMLRSGLLHLLQAKRQAGPGSWQQQVEAEVTEDGRTLLVAAAIPLRNQPDASPPPQTLAPPAERDHIGRPTEVPRDLARYIRSHPDCHYSDILEAMGAKGHSRTAAGDNLKVLVKLGYVRHEGKGTPYRWHEPDAESS